MKKFLLYALISLMCLPIAFADQSESTILPAMQFDFKAMPAPQQLENALGRYRDYVEDASTASPPLVVQVAVSNKNASYPPLYNATDFFDNDENALSTFAYGLNNIRLLEAILANGYHIEGYAQIMGEEKPIRGLAVTIYGYNRVQQTFYGEFADGAKTELAYEYVTSNMVYAEIGQTITRDWQLQFVIEDSTDEELRHLCSKTFSVTAIDLATAITLAYQQLQQDSAVTLPQGKFYCRGHLAPTISTAAPNFVKFNYELYMYKYKGGQYGVGYVINVPYRVQTQYSQMQFTRLWIDKTRCSNYIGDQHDRCEGWGSFYIDHVAIATTFFPSGIIEFKIVAFRNCNVAKYSFPSYKTPAIVRGGTEWIAY